MSVPNKPNGSSTPGRETGDFKASRDTVLLSEVPDAASLMAVAPVTPFQIANLSSTALAALSRRYDILGEAGHGSMVNVYKARDRETGETVALKLLKPEIASDQAMMDRFKNELLYARKITHKNVCRVHEFNRIGGIAYTSMEFVEGESLRSGLKRFWGLPLRKANHVALQICSGLAEAHAQGIVHRDLKPENVMIDAQGNVKIMDFGIARSMEAGTRLTGSIAGTPAYMAPEQVSGKQVDYRTDIYSLGLMLYEMFTGTPAFAADTAVAVALKQMRETPQAPHEIDPTIPVGSERAILKCRPPQPAKPFQTVVAILRLLRSMGSAESGDAAGNANSSRERQAAPALSFRSLQTEPASKGTSVWTWLLVIVVGALGALGGLRAMGVKQSAERLPPPPRIAAPKPPEFALNSSPGNTAVEKATAPPVETKRPRIDPKGAAAEPKRTEAQPTPVIRSDGLLEGPRVRAQQQRAAASAELLRREGASSNRTSQQQARAGVTPDVQQRSDKATSDLSSATGNDASTYLWVGRYALEDRAQKAAKKIQDLGLPVTVIPRHNATGDFFLVVTGPFGGQRVASVTQWLETQGFSNVHPFTLPGANHK